ncbi:MAG: DUF983 domain-containing protein [Chryseolinea sp.]
MPRSYLSAVLNTKCPKCREGNMFAYSAANLSKFNVMNDRCPVCGVRLEPEPGFYQGAMYVGYGFTVALIAIVGVTLYLTWDPSEWTYSAIVILLAILMAPLNYRYSRVLYLYWFGGIKYDPSHGQIHRGI